MRENGGIVSGLYIKLKALKYMQENHPNVQFKASDGWLIFKSLKKLKKKYRKNQNEQND
jgi:hypothetical protein